MRRDLQLNSYVRQALTRVPMPVEFVERLEYIHKRRIRLAESRGKLEVEDHVRSAWWNLEGERSNVKSAYPQLVHGLTSRVEKPLQGVGVTKMDQVQLKHAQGAGQ